MTNPQFVPRADSGKHVSQSTVRKKKWRLYILPRFLGNLTQPIGTHRKPYFREMFPRNINIMHVRSEVFITFLCVFISGFRIFVHQEFWVNVLDAMDFLRECCRTRNMTRTILVCSWYLTCRIRTRVYST